MWHGRFNGRPDKLMQDFSESVSFDQRLWREDIAGSLAYARELCRIKLLTRHELAEIERGFAQITREIERGKFKWKLELEDVHMNIEARLTEIIGEPGKKLHTGRSRNDQVATDLTLWMYKRCVEIEGAARALGHTIADRAEENLDVIIPAYTHLQRAQPVRMAHQLAAYGGWMADDAGQLSFQRLFTLTDFPLGSGACAGNSFGVDMHELADSLSQAADPRLRQRRTVYNSMRGVGDRDTALDLLYVCAKMMTHLSRMAEDLILWSTAEFGFVTLGDAVTTGSSIMPQKRNPDACELVRGKAARVVSRLMQLFMLLKALPLAYNRDLQEDKEAIFDATDETLACLQVMTLVFSKENFRVNRKRIKKQLESGEGFMEAMNVADWLVTQGVPFRQAHEITGKLVKYCEDHGKRFADLTAEDLAKVDKRHLKPALLKELSLEALVERKNGFAGTAKKQVQERLKDLRRFLKG